MKLQQTICVPLNYDNDALVISRGSCREENNGGEHVRIKVVEDDKTASTEISLSVLLGLIQENIR